MGSEHLLKVIIVTSILVLLSSCAPGSFNLNSFQQSSSEESSIVGGKDSTTEYAERNGIVGIYDMEHGGLCTGNLIGDGLVLTAGHCANVDNPTKMIVFFGPDLHAIELEVQQGNYDNIRHVLKVVRHETYKSNHGNDSKSSDDISLLRFQGSAAARFKAVALATSLQSALLKVGDSVSLAGYGLSVFKQDPKSGQELVSQGVGLLRQVADIKVLSMLPTLQEITLDQSKGHGACHGDSGGPAYVVDPATRKTYLIGVTSRGSGNCDETATYTGVIGYSSWIQQNSLQLIK